MADVGSEIFFRWDIPAFEFHAIIVKSLHENRKFNTIKMCKNRRELIYLRPEDFPIPENEEHRLLLRGPKHSTFGEYETVIIIGDETWNWYACFHEAKYRNFGIQSVVVKDPKFPEAAVEVIFERIEKPAQAHFSILFKDDRNKDREINIIKGEIWATSNGGDHRTKRLLRCFGDDLEKHMEPSSESPKSKKLKSEQSKFKLVSGKPIDLYKSHMFLPASEGHKKSQLFIHFNLELEFEVGGTKHLSSFLSKASLTAPTDPHFLQYKEFIPRAMEITKETHILGIDDFAKMEVEISWFNDISHDYIDCILWGYGDGDCDYKGYRWADRQEIDWNDPEQVKAYVNS